MNQETYESTRLCGCGGNHESCPGESEHRVSMEQKRGKWRWRCTCGEKGSANTSIEADWWSKRHQL